MRPEEEATITKYHHLSTDTPYLTITNGEEEDDGYFDTEDSVAQQVGCAELGGLFHGDTYQPRRRRRVTLRFKAQDMLVRCHQACSYSDTTRCPVQMLGFICLHVASQ